MGLYPLESPLRAAIRRAVAFRRGELTYLRPEQWVADDWALRVAEEAARQNLAGLGHGEPGQALGRNGRAAHEDHRLPAKDLAPGTGSGAPVGLPGVGEARPGSVSFGQRGTDPNNFDKGGTA
jgi:hypothetical protein